MKNRLKQIRQRAGLRQKEFGERLGVSAKLVANWECGAAVPGDARIYKLCKEFNVREEWLRTGSGEPFEPDPKALAIDAIERAFCLRVFDSLPPDIQDKILDLMREQIELERRGARDYSRRLDNSRADKQITTVAKEEPPKDPGAIA